MFGQSGRFLMVALVAKYAAATCQVGYPMPATICINFNAIDSRFFHLPLIG